MSDLITIFYHNRIARQVKTTIKSAKSKKLARSF